MPFLDQSSSARPIRIGVSRCLLGDQVRYDGGHKRNSFVADILSRHVEWVPVCPEVEAGLGTPREPMRLVGTSKRPRLMTMKTQQDKTEPLAVFAAQKLESFEATDLSGYVFKDDSPSCGVERVRILDSKGRQSRTGVGLFARVFMERFPLIPIEEDGHLSDPHAARQFY